MKIILMCGGREKRLSALTEKIPKPLEKVNNQIILNVTLEQFSLPSIQHNHVCPH